MSTQLLTHLCLPSTLVAEHLLSAGYEGYILDLQHGELDIAAAIKVLHATSRSAAAPYARLGGIDEAVITRLLDNGCRGIIAPMVETVAQCEALVAATLYPPLGSRSFGPMRPGLYADVLADLADGADLGDAANSAVLPMIQIESVAGVEAAEQLLDVPGVRGVYLGPADLARSYGLGFGTDWTEGPVWDAIEHVTELARARGQLVGIFCGSPEYAAKLAAAGRTDYIGLVGDLMLLNRSALAHRDEYQAALAAASTSA